jgi:hypothetical protein
MNTNKLEYLEKQESMKVKGKKVRKWEDKLPARRAYGPEGGLAILSIS